jgi:sentrin-specific protease 1
MVLNRREKTLNLHDILHAVISHSFRARVIMEISRYLLNKHRKKLGKDFRDLSGYARNDSVPTPQQQNSFDCGVFFCQVAETLSREKPLTFKQGDIPFLRQRMMWEVTNERLLT